MNILRWTAVPTGVGLALATPAVVAQGDTAHTFVGTGVALAFTVAAGLWGYHGFVATGTAIPTFGRVFAGVMAGGLLIAATSFFLAIGAAVATLGAVFYGAVLSSRPSRRVRGQGVMLVATAVAIVAIVVAGDISTERTFWFATVAFSLGMGASTALLAGTPTRTQGARRR